VLVNQEKLNKKTNYGKVIGFEDMGMKY